MSTNIQAFAKNQYGINAVHSSALGDYYKRITEGREGLQFHHWQAEDRNADPVPYAMYNGACVKVGTDNAKNFMDKVYDHRKEGHESALQAFANDFFSDPNAVTAYCISKARSLMGAKRLEIKNDAYENNKFKGFNSDSAIDQSFIHKLKNLLASKWGAVGYDGDDNLIDAFIKDHPFTRDPRPVVNSNSIPSNLAYNQEDFRTL